MKAVWKNPIDPPKTESPNPVRCEVCGKVGFPYPPWSFYEFGVGWEMDAYDYQFYVCSDKCNENCEEAKKKKRIELNEAYARRRNMKMPKWVKDILYK